MRTMTIIDKMKDEYQKYNRKCQKTDIIQQHVYPYAGLAFIL